MAANDKLIPNAITIANNLQGVRLSTSNTFRQPSKKVSKYDNPLIDAINYIASIYAKEVKVADNNAVWNYTLVNDKPQVDPFTLNQNIHHLNLGMVLAISESEWNELQVTISKVINIIYPLKSSYFSAYSIDEFQNFIDLMGIRAGGATQYLLLRDAANNIIQGPGPGGSWLQGISYVDAWNNIKVPTDAALEVVTPYLAPIYKPVGQTSNFYRYTGIRRWDSPYTGYNTY